MTFRIIGTDEAVTCQPHASQCNVSLSFPAVGLYILSIFADGNEVTLWSRRRECEISCGQQSRIFSFLSKYRPAMSEQIKP